MEMMIAALMGDLAAFGIGWYIRGRWQHGKSNSIRCLKGQKLVKFRYPSSAVS
jgi:hypothetical protein